MRAASARRIADALTYFSAYVKSHVGSDEINVDTLLSNYVTMRRTLTREMQAICSDLLVTGESILEHHCEKINARMKKLFGLVAAPDLLNVRGYHSVHSLLLEYLARHLGEPVAVSRLRVLTGDQVHTERRVRELRDLGFDITWKKTGGEDNYVLKTLEVDWDAVALNQFKRNVENSDAISAEIRQRLKVMIGKLSAS
jgi:hypothetical protein